MGTEWNTAVLSGLVDSSVRILGVAVVVSVVLLVTRIRASDVLHGVWTGVLCAMLLMPVLVWITPPLGLPEIPGLQLALSRTAPSPRPSMNPGTVQQAVPAPPGSNLPEPVTVSVSPTGGPDWPTVILLVYAAGTLVLLLRLWLGWLAMTRLVRATRRAVVPVGFSAYESDKVSSPVTVGIVRPRIVLPENRKDWSSDKLRSVLVHESAHIRRRDALVGLLARLNTAIFWFHPVAWWLERKLAVTAEQACDDVVVRHTGEARRYAAVLVELAESVRQRGGRLAWKGDPMAGAGTLQHRIERLLSGDVLHTVSTRRKTLVSVVCAAVIYLSAASQQQAASTTSSGQDASVAGPQPGNSSGTPVDPADVAFGYTDGTGSKLLMLSQMNNLPISEARAKTMAWAVCSEGREFPIHYVQFQKSTPVNSGRQNADSFAENDGHLSEIVQGQAAPGDTCLLVPAGYLQAFPISRNEFPKVDRDRRSGEYGQRRARASIQKRPFDLTPFQSLSEFAKQSVGRIEKEKGRTAKIYWPLHRIGASQEVAAVEFNAIGDSLLGSLVLVEPTRLSFFDMPASIKWGRENGGCWRVDDDCEFHYSAMEIPAVLGEPGRQLVFFTFAGYEGLLIVLFQPRDGKLVEVARNYRPSWAR